MRNINFYLTLLTICTFWFADRLFPSASSALTGYALEVLTSAPASLRVQEDTPHFSFHPDIGPS